LFRNKTVLKIFFSGIRRSGIIWGTVIKCVK
jgi:hypothetical protein